MRTSIARTSSSARPERSHTFFDQLRIKRRRGPAVERVHQEGSRSSGYGGAKNAPAWAGSRPEARRRGWGTCLQRQGRHPKSEGGFQARGRGSRGRRHRALRPRSRSGRPRATPPCASSLTESRPDRDGYAGRAGGHAVRRSTTLASWPSRAARNGYRHRRDRGPRGAQRGASLAGELPARRRVARRDRSAPPESPHPPSRPQPKSQRDSQR